MHKNEHEHRHEHDRRRSPARGGLVPFLGLAVVPIAMLAAACGGPAPSPDETAPPIALEHVGTIGCDGCDDERQVTPVALAILDDERVGVLDAYEPFVRVFTTGGEPQLSFGAKGEGPGELGLALPGGSGYLPGLWLFGNELGGITVIAAPI